MPVQDASDGYENLADIAEATKNEGNELRIVLRDVIRHYSELNADLKDFYEKNLKRFPERTAEVLNDFHQSVQTFKEDAKKFGESMMEKTAPEKFSGFNISKIFANSIFLLLVSFVASFIGSYITSPVIGIIFLNLGAILVVTIVIPIGASYVYHNLSVKSLAEKRIASTGFIIIQSILIGFINQNNWMKSSPMTITSQAVASFVYPLVLAHTDNRQKILLAVAGSSILAHMTTGLIVFGIDGGFMILVILYTFLALSLIQYSIAFRPQTDFDMMHLAMQYVFLVSIVKMFALMSLGNEKSKK